MLTNFTDHLWLSQIFLSIISISIIDLVLSGDNAAVIGLAIRNLPRRLQKKAVVFGASGAIILRIIFTIFAVYLLSIKYLSAVGGVILLWITYNLVKSNSEDKTFVKGANSFWPAVGTIIIADLSMAFDNVMGVAGAAHGKPLLVIFGLILSIPILIIGSTWLATLMEKFRIIIFVGAMVLVHTATSMIINDQALGLVNYIGEVGCFLIPWLCSLSVLIYGLFETIL